MYEENFSLFDFERIFNDEIRVSYRGPFDKHVLALLGDYINLIFGKDPDAGRKMFKIFLELAQNISYYSFDRSKLSPNEEDSGVGVLMIRETDNNYFIHVGNQILINDVIPIIEKCEYINTLNKEELREYKRKQRLQAPGVKGGAHIGLIQVALTSANPLEFKVTYLDEKVSFFEVKVNINKRVS